MSSEKRKIEDDASDEAKIEDESEPKKIKTDTEEESEPKKGNTEECSNGDAKNGEETADTSTSTTADSKSKDKSSTKEPAGTLLICGQMNWDLTGRTKLPKKVTETKSLCLWNPHVLTPLAGVRIHRVISGCAAAHSIVIDDQGQAWSWGRNDHGQLGQGDLERRNIPTLITSLKGMIFKSGASARSHTLLVSDKGEIYSFGSNNMGQCGIGSQGGPVSTPKKVKFESTNVEKVSCGGEFSLILDQSNCLHTFGCPEYGQLGHNTDGKYMDGNRYGFHCELVPTQVTLYIEKERDGTVLPIRGVEIMDAVCGINHTVALDKKGRVFSWGFGGYGRLGHDSPKDEYVPRLVKYFDGPNRGADRVYAGSTYSVATMNKGAMYVWGQRGRSGEANMYPKPVQDLHGWQVRSVGTSYSSLVIAADDSIISWGSSPCYGELGHGEGRKSSSKPMEIRSLDGIYAHEISCGMAHSLFIARDDGAEDRQLLEQLPEYDPE